MQTLISNVLFRINSNAILKALQVTRKNRKYYFNFFLTYHFKEMYVKNFFICTLLITKTNVCLHIEFIVSRIVFQK